MRRRDFLGAVGAGLVLPWNDWRGGQSMVWISASEAAAAIRGKRVSSVELTRQALERIDRLNPQLNALVQIFRDQALARAREADAAAARNEWWGPLHGVPVTAKESFGIAGAPATAGAPFLRNNLPREDSIPVARLRQAGAVLLGSTNVPFMLSDWQSYNEIYGTSNNPWDRTRTPGGSSGGSAAALAAGIGHLSIGSDIGGSIRIPAHFSGVYGHKPTINVVPMNGHIPPLPGQSAPALVDLPVGGPMARTAADLRLGLEVLGGPAEPASRAYRWTLPASRHTALRDFRIGMVLDDPACPVTDDTRMVLERMADALRRAGAAIATGWPDGVDPRVQYQTYLYLLGTYFAAQLPDSLEEPTRRAAAQPDSSVQGIWNRAWTDPVKRLQRQGAMAERLQAAWGRWFQQHDVFLMPTAFSPAIPHDHSPQPSRRIATSSGPREYMDLIWWIAGATLAGLPATTAPVGLTTAGLPVGVQIVGPYLEDATPIAFAEALAGAIGGFKPPPGF